jgi:RNA polymerase sigma-70 factor (ECF subfamily)
MHSSARFQRLIARFQEDLYRYAYWLCGHAQQAEDLVQESFLRAWKNLDSLREETLAKAWLFTILRHEHARQYARASPVFLDLEAQELLTGSEEDSEIFSLRRLIAKLPREYREPLVLQVLGGFSQAEIAQLLELNENTVATRLFRARQHLKSWYEGACAQARIR